MTETLRATLPVDVVYVYGTVNGEETTWTRTQGDDWESIVDRVPDDTYVIHLEATNSAGTQADFDFTLYYGILHLITDRTLQDVNRVKTLSRKGTAGMTAEELEAWNAGTLKGAYNYTDLNRVNGAVNYIAGRFEEIGCMVMDDGGILFSNRKVVWESSEVPTTDDMTDYLHWVKAIRDLLSGNVDTNVYWLPEDMDMIDYEDANAIERALRFVDGMIDRIKAGWYFSGELYGGEV